MKRYIGIVIVMCLVNYVGKLVGMPEWWQGVIVGGVLMDALNRPRTECAVEYDSHGYARYSDVLS